MPNTQRVLIVGGGIAGMACAISMANAEHTVDLIDIDPDWRSYGTGITVQAPTFRALRQLGLADEVAAAGFPCRGARVRLANGMLIDEVLSQKLEPGLPDGGGIMRPMLHNIMARETRGSGVNVRLGVSVSDFVTKDDGVDVTFTDGTKFTYDLMVAADGIYSSTRERLFPDAPKPRFTGQGAFRVLAPRPVDLDMIETFLGNPIKAGVTPISRDELYMFVLSPENHGEFMTHDQQVGRLREVLADFGGIIAEIRDSLTADSRIVYRPLEALFLPKPWHLGRTILIGDAVHATTPQLASGAGAAIEDGILLSHYLSVSATIEEALLDFTERRFERCRHVVESSLQLGEMELAGAPGDEQGRLYEQALARLAEPA